MHAAPPPSMASDGIWTKTDKGDDGHQHQVEGAEDRTDSPAMYNIERGGTQDTDHGPLPWRYPTQKIPEFSGVCLEN